MDLARALRGASQIRLTGDVSSRAPRVCGLVSPCLDVGLTPFAKTIQNRVVLSFKRIPHDHVAFRSTRLTVVVSRWTVISGSADCQFQRPSDVVEGNTQSGTSAVREWTAI